MGGGIGGEEAHRRRMRERRSWVQNIFRILDPNIWKLHPVIMHLRSQPSERKWQENENPGRMLFSFEM